MCVCVCMCVCLSTSPPEQDASQVPFFSGFKQVWIHSFNVFLIILERKVFLNLFGFDPSNFSRQVKSCYLRTSEILKTARKC